MPTKITLTLIFSVSNFRPEQEARASGSFQDNARCPQQRCRRQQRCCRQRGRRRQETRHLFSCLSPSMTLINICLSHWSRN